MIHERRGHSNFSKISKQHHEKKERHEHRKWLTGQKSKRGFLWLICVDPHQTAHRNIWPIISFDNKQQQNDKSKNI